MRWWICAATTLFYFWQCPLLVLGEERDWRGDLTCVQAALQSAPVGQRDILVLVDVSGSMSAQCESSPWGLSRRGEAQWALLTLARESFRPDDLVLLAEVDFGYRVVSTFDLSRQHFDINSVSRPTAPELGSNLYYAHLMALRDIKQQGRVGAWKAIIVISDGFLDKPRDEPWASEFDKYLPGTPGWDTYCREAKAFANTFGIGVKVDEKGRIVPSQVGETSGDQLKTGVIVTQAVDLGTGSPIEGAAVRVYGVSEADSAQEKTVDSKGVAIFPFVRPGLYELVVTAPGYTRQSLQGVRVFAGEITNTGAVRLERRSLGWAVLVLVLVAVGIVASFIARSGRRKIGVAAPPDVIYELTYKDGKKREVLKRTQVAPGVELDPQGGVLIITRSDQEVTYKGVRAEPNREISIGDGGNLAIGKQEIEVRRKGRLSG